MPKTKIVRPTVKFDNLCYVTILNETELLLRDETGTLWRVNRTTNTATKQKFSY